MLYDKKKKKFFEMSSGRIIVTYKSNFDFYKSTTVLDDYLYRSDCTKNWWDMSTINYDKAVHLIVHGQRDLIDSIKNKLASLGFADEKLVPASLEKAGNVGEYVAMAWPPMHATEVILSEITGLNQGESTNNVMGAWSNISQKEISRIPLSWMNRLSSYIKIRPYYPIRYYDS